MFKYQGIIRFFSLVSVMFLLTSCYLVERVTKDVKMQAITVVTPMAEGALCTVTDARGKKYRAKKTPYVVTVRQGVAPLTFICKKQGYKTAIAYLNENRVAQSVVNLPDEIIGIATNPFASMATVFPQSIDVWMEPNQWLSEGHMRDWAFERSLSEHRQFLQDKEKEEAYRKRVESNKFFKNWANNAKDKSQRRGEYGYDTAYTHDPKVIMTDEMREQRFKDAVAAWGQSFADTFDNIVTYVTGVEEFDWKSWFQVSKPSPKKEETKPASNLILQKDMKVRPYPALPDQRSQNKGRVLPSDMIRHYSGEAMSKEEGYMPSKNDMPSSLDGMDIDPEAVQRWKRVNPTP